MRVEVRLVPAAPRMASGSSGGPRPTDTHHPNIRPRARGVAGLWPAFSSRATFGLIAFVLTRILRGLWLVIILMSAILRARGLLVCSAAISLHSRLATAVHLSSSHPLWLRPVRIARSTE